MKEFNCDKKQYFRHVTFSGIICILLFIILLYFSIVSSGNFRSLFLIGALSAIYTVWNTFISNSNPEKIVIEDDLIKFLSFGKIHEFKISDIKTFYIKEFSIAKKQYIRINGGGILKNRYWIHCLDFEKGNDLYNEILNFEYKVNPKSLRSIARRKGESDV